MPRGIAKQSLLFLHQPKTAGSTLTGVFSNRFATEETLALYFGDPRGPDLNGYRYVAGHLPISFAAQFQHPPYVVTFLRDPVERALSSYSYVRSLPPSYQPPGVPYEGGRNALESHARYRRLARESSIAELVTRDPEIAREYLGNRQARSLSDPAVQAGDESVERALDGLGRCDFVGVFERLDESADLLARRFGWRPLAPLPRVNVTTARVRLGEISPSALEALRELNTVDGELHRHAAERFDRQLAEWTGTAGGRDYSVEIDDAVAVSDLRFERPIPGGGWVGRERLASSPAFCWIGHTNSAWVELARPADARLLRIEIAHVLDAEILSGLRVAIDGSVIAAQLSEEGDAVVAIAPLPPRRPSRQPTVRVTLQVDRAVRPCDVNPESSDDRLLSIAVRRIAALAG